MRAGTLRHKVTFKSLTLIEDDFGEAAHIWNDFCTTRVSIRPLKAQEHFMSSHLKMVLTHELHMRYVDGINSTMKIVFGTREFKIDSVLNLYEKNRELKLVVSEVF